MIPEVAYEVSVDYACQTRKGTYHHRHRYKRVDLQLSSPVDWPRILKWGSISSRLAVDLSINVFLADHLGEIQREGFEMNSCSTDWCLDLNCSLVVGSLR